jgi:Calpain family cysteine protease/Domain of unknown function (DUF4157)
MERQHRSRGTGFDHGGGVASAGTPGKRTLTEALPPIQAKAAGGGAVGAGNPDAAVHDIAAKGTAGAGTALPYVDAIQRSFGRHDVGHIKAHVGGAAAEAAQGIGAEAYAAGDHVAFAGAPSLHTAAHEAAHVVQQRAGVHLKGGVGEAGDAYEQHADAVADRVVRGESAEDLLEAHAGGGGTQAVQRKPSDLRTAFGGHAQLNLPLVKQIQNPNWNAYVLNIKPYFKLDDSDEERQASMFYTVASRERSLREDALEESGKEPKQQDPWKRFAPAQLTLSNQISERLEREKREIYGDGSNLGQLDPSLDARKVRVRDNKIIHGGTELVEHGDPAQGFGANALFPQKPTMDDIQQGALGDCYLLAAMASVVQRDADHFIRHMKDNLDGTVTVRLYSAVDTPLLVTVDKTVVGQKYAKNTLWVKLLEKAYVASGLKTKTIGDGNDKRYSDIAGGASDEALMHLTGRGSETFALGQGRRKFQLAAPHLMMQAVSDLKREMGEIGDKQSKLTESIKLKQQGSKDADVSEEQGQLKVLGERFEVLVNEWQAMMAPTQELEEMLSRVYISEKTFNTFLEKHDGNELLKRVVAQAGLKHGSLPGELGSGRYGVDEEAAFNKIKVAVDARKPMTASTKSVIKDADNPEEHERGNAGESKVNGLASAHAYSVLDYRPTPEEYRQGDMIMIKLRNPWGSYGRKYEKVKEKVRGVADTSCKGDFWIDLADLVAYFDNLAIGG